MTTTPTIYEAALNYVKKGFSIIPCEGKKAAVAWSPFQKRRTRRDDVDRWHAAGLLNNVAIICGEVSRNLVVVDLDGDAAVFSLSVAFPELFETYIVRSGSGHGAHLYFRCKTMPRTTRGVGLSVGNIEVRADGCYVVAPPSIHPTSRMPYVVSNRQSIAQLSNLDKLTSWIEQLNREKHGPAPKPPAPAPVVAGNARIERWALAALRGEAILVSRALEGTRNSTLNRAAFKMGQLVGGGWISRADVEGQLMAAAAQLAAQEGEQTVIKTIRSGLEAGIKQPRGGTWR